MNLQWISKLSPRYKEGKVVVGDGLCFHCGTKMVADTTHAMGPIHGMRCPECGLETGIPWYDIPWKDIPVYWAEWRARQ